MLHLNERWRIDNESHSEELILEKLTKIVGKKNGKKTGNDREEWKHVGYYTTLGGHSKGSIDIIRKVERTGRMCLTA